MVHFSMVAGFIFSWSTPHRGHLLRRGASEKFVTPLGETLIVDDNRVDGHAEKENESLPMIKSYCALYLKGYASVNETKD